MGTSSTIQGTTHGRKKSHCHNIDDTDSESETEMTAADPTKPWLNEWNTYIQTHEIIPEGMGIVRWWGVCIFFQVFWYNLIILKINGRHYPTWVSFSHDYLLIMASSVSSEWAFSAAGITIGKRRNRLKGDVVEALQCLKCLIHHDLLFRDVVVATDLEIDLECDIINREPSDSAETVIEADKFSWDKVLDDNVEDENEEISN